jgi:hypothetical protein
MRRHSGSVDDGTSRNVANPGASPDPVAKPTNRGNKSTGTKGRPVTDEKGALSSHSVRSDPGGEG